MALAGGKPLITVATCSAISFQRSARAALRRSFGRATGAGRTAKRSPAPRPHVVGVHRRGAEPPHFLTAADTDGTSVW
jgi:hypothetical protein